MASFAADMPLRAPAPPPLRTAAAALEPNALKTGALLLILGCFAVSGAIRASEMLEGVEPSSWSVASWFASAPTEDGENAAPAQAVEIDPAALEAAQREAAALEAAILSGAISTASIGDAAQGSAAAESGVEFSDRPAPRGARVAGDNLDAAARLLQSLRAREAELDAFSERLRQRQIELDAAARRVEERIGELERNKEEFAALVASVDQASERDVEHLIEMYSKMKPKDAGALFDSMAPAFAAGFLGRMRSDKASAILANMSREKAYAVSLQIAGRNVQRRPAGEQ